jgi:glycosyltransferase involved in cell wall biosynthesis
MGVHSNKNPTLFRIHFRNYFNKELRGKMRKRNKKLIKEKYSWDGIAEKIMEVYNEVLKEG